MKALRCALLMVLVSVSCVAQFNSSFPTNNSSLKTSPLFIETAANCYYKAEVMPPGYRMKNTGMVLVIGDSIIDRGRSCDIVNLKGDRAAVVYRF